MDSCSNISTHTSPEAATEEQARHLEGSESMLGRKDPVKVAVVDVSTQTEAKLFESTEVARFISNSRQELERRVEDLERELNRIERERDAAIIEAFDARRRSPSPTEPVDLLTAEPTPPPPPSAVSTLRSLPFAAFKSVLSIFPSFKRPIAPLPSRAISPAPSPVTLLSRIRSASPPLLPSTQSNSPGPTFSLLLSPHDSRPAPPDLLSQLSILWLGNLDTGVTPFLILYFFRLPRSEPFPRPLAISKTHSGNIMIGLRTEKDVKRVRSILSKDAVLPGFSKKFQVQKNLKGSYQFKWNHLSNEVRESWSADQTLPEEEFVDPDEDGERYEVEKESILKMKRSSREPSLAQRISGGGNRKDRRKPLQKQSTPTPAPVTSSPAIPVNLALSSIPSTPAINFAAPPVPAFMLAPFPSTPATFPATTLTPVSSPAIPNPFSRPGYGGSSNSSIPQRRSLSAETEEQKEKKPRTR